MADELEALRTNCTQRAKLDAERDDLIVAAKRAKKPVTHIADAAGLSRMQVHRILEARGAGATS